MQMVTLKLVILDISLRSAYSGFKIKQTPGCTDPSLDRNQTPGGNRVGFNRIGTMKSHKQRRQNSNFQPNKTEHSIIKKKKTLMQCLK